MMKINKKKAFLAIPVLFLSLSIVVTVIAHNITKSEAQEHAIKPAVSFNDNPLKGFVPFSSSYADFPHSMEFFYIPMSVLYPDPNSTPDSAPDFTQFEKELNVIAERGNQAVIRIYIDYPSDDPDYRPIGIPKFLRNEPYNLETHDYGEFKNYISRIPDYSNPYLRKTIQNCIKALGNKYDGDKRIAFFTGGFLGFWGEWHCWPYNGVNKAVNYEPSIEVFNETIDAYNEAFKKTKILFRYPKGNDIKDTKFGYHDDSYCYETVPSELGGESYNFGEILKNTKPSTAERWKTAPIGGELRPEIQRTIFATEPWTGAPDKPRESWETNLNIIHPSWMINEAIKEYKGDVRVAAEKAAQQMGYDLQVTTAYFQDIMESTDKLSLNIKMKNIGVAPFYYNHEMWPVKIGVKQNNKIIKEWTTKWNLNEVAADGEEVSFKFKDTVKNGLDTGYYTICIKAQSPLENGNPLGFANEFQDDDGWLDLGIIGIGDVSGLQKPELTAKPPHRVKTQPKSETAAASDPNTYEAEAESNTIEGGTKTESGPKYSGGMKAGYIGNNSGILQFNNVNAEKDGEYQLIISYTTQEARSMSISINGEPAIEVDFEPALTWTKVLEKEVTVKLKTGSNIIKFFNEAGWAPDIDKIRIREIK